MIDFECKSHYDVGDLVKIVYLLRAPGGCPWDREQDHASIRRNLLEEAYEAAEAIDEQDQAHLLEELGDVLLQVVFHAQIERERGGFDLSDVADGVCKKLIHRHPHVFGDVKADSSQQVLANWDQIKQAEKKQKSTGDVMDSVARSLPGLWRAEKVQAKASKAGTDLGTAAAALELTAASIDGLRRALDAGEDGSALFGQLLFSAVAAGRLAGLDGEAALAQRCETFIQDFRRMEACGQLQADKLYNTELKG